MKKCGHSVKTDDHTESSVLNILSLQEGLVERNVHNGGIIQKINYFSIRKASLFPCQFHTYNSTVKLVPEYPCTLDNNASVLSFFILWHILDNAVIF